mgnify:CR=1 FL=1
MSRRTILRSSRGSIPSLPTNERSTLHSEVAREGIRSSFVSGPRTYVGGEPDLYLARSAARWPMDHARGPAQGHGTQGTASRRSAGSGSARPGSRGRAGPIGGSPAHQAAHPAPPGMRGLAVSAGHSSKQDVLIITSYKGHRRRVRAACRSLRLRTCFAGQVGAGREPGLQGLAGGVPSPSETSDAVDS